jgi:hypothetical protein
MENKKTKDEASNDLGSIHQKQVKKSTILA